MIQLSIRSMLAPRDGRMPAPPAARRQLLLLASLVALAMAPGAATAAAPAASVVVLPPTDPEGSLELLWESAGPAPSAPGTWQPAIDPAGHIWVSVQADSVFWIFDRDGTYLETWGTQGDDDGELDFVTQYGGFGAVAFRPDGGFYVADSGNARVQQFDADRAFVRSWGTFGTEDGQFTVPQGIAVDGSGNVFVIDDPRHDVQVFDADGRFLRRIPTVAPFFGVDQAGRTYNVDWEVPTLRRFGVDGTIDLVVDGSAGPFGYSIALVGDDRVFLGALASGGAPADRIIELDDTGTVAHVWETGAESIVVDPAGDRLYAAAFDWPFIRAYALPTDG